MVQKWKTLWKTHPLLAVTLHWLGFLLLNQNDTGIGDLNYCLFLYLCVAVLGCSVLVNLVVMLFKRIYKRPYDYSFRHNWLPLIIIFIGIIVISIRPAFYVRFIFSLPALTQYVHDVRAGKFIVSHTDFNGCYCHIPSRELQIGLFMIWDTDITNTGAVRMLTSCTMVYGTGLVYAEHEPPVIRKDRYTHLFGPWWWWEDQNL